ncbi:glycosyltransferase family 2 protein [Paenibacillus gansuensis]|uniref:Glycosyltransferase family 2 protein n=1 Tax=Paenibacillus gansuensis TaxID=306542 RepID=A0ABW5PH17_9BACL
MDYNISIVIVNYNGKKYIDALFDSFLKQDLAELTYEIVFVDNNSTDDSISYLEDNYAARFNNLKIVNSKENLGFAGGNNLGVANSSGEYIVFLNNDTKVEPDWLLQLYECIRSHNAGIVTSKLIFFYDFVKFNVQTADKFEISNRVSINGHEYKLDPKFCKNMLVYDEHSVCFGHSEFYLPLLQGSVDYDITINAIDVNQAKATQATFSLGDAAFEIGNNILLTETDVASRKLKLLQNVGSGIDSNFNGYDMGFCEEDHGQYERVYEVETTCGAAMMMKKDVFEKVGGFDNNFFMYYEDTDLAFRVKRQGMKLLYCPTAVVRHIHTGSSKEWSPFFIFHVYRNRMLFILKNYSRKIFIKEYLKFIFSISINIISKQNKEIKTAKLNSLKSFMKLLPKYL